ncbi:MAG TPA: hypothetical protein VF337_00690, partial [Candidatus Limnocylindrales bacterium]
MSISIRRAAVAALVAAGVLLLANWFDAGVVADAKIRAGSTYDSGPLMNAVVLARLLTAAGVVAV